MRRKAARRKWWTQMANEGTAGHSRVKVRVGVSYRLWEQLPIIDVERQLRCVEER